LVVTLILSKANMPTTTPPVKASPAANGSASPLVSVIIPYYNQERFLGETVDSVRRQTYLNFEIILVDDGSRVPATVIVQEDARLRIYRTENRGLPAARNFGFQQCSGQFLVFLDSDDRLHPDALRCHLDAFSANASAALSFGAQRIIDAEGEEIRPSHTCRPRRDYFLKLLEGNPISTPGATMIRREAFLEAGKFDETLRIVEDYPLYLRIARKYPLAHSSTCVIDYRFHKASMSQNKEKVLAGVLHVLDKLEAEGTLSAAQRRQLRYGRRRWMHECRQKKALIHRLRSYYYRFRSMLDVPIHSYFQMF
jgi:glycosyltransferase involved in cell wall biosynthesis